MDSKMMSLQIDQEMVKTVLEKQIQAAILASLGDVDQFIAKIVSLNLHQKVDKNGNVSKYNSDNNYDFLEIVAGDAIRKAAKEALAEWLKEKSALVKEAVIKEMNKPARQKSLAQAFANACEENMKCNWRFNCDIKFLSDD